jgi:hypothetical protein
VRLQLNTGPGRAASQLAVSDGGELSEADVSLLRLPRHSAPPTIAKIRESHHALARALASGISDTEAGLSTGYSSSRISILRSDPAFQELLAAYTREADGLRLAVQADGVAKMYALHADAVEEIHDRLRENPDGIETKDLLDVVKATADRTGLGPTVKSVNTHITVTADRLIAARKRLEALDAPRVIEERAQPDTSNLDSGEDVVTPVLPAREPIT